MKIDTVIPVHPSAAVAAKYGLTVEEGQDVEPLNLTFEMMNNLKFKTVLEKGDGPLINGETMRSRAKKMNANLGLADGERLKDHMNKFPNKFKKLRNDYIVLPGTLLCNFGDVLRVAFLHWFGDCWVMCFHGIGSDWSGFRFACREPARR